MTRFRTRSLDIIEQDFRDALDRLKMGKPQRPEFRENIRKGNTVKINISTVAKEAGRARGLIARENCRFPAVRQLILIEQGAAGVEPRNRDDVIANLRAQVADLRAKLADSMAHQANHFDRRTKAERKAEDYQDRYERLREQH